MTQFDERTAAEPIPDVSGAGRPRGAGGWATRGLPGPPKRSRLDPRIRCGRSRGAFTLLRVFYCSAQPREPQLHMA